MILNVDLEMICHARPTPSQKSKCFSPTLAPFYLSVYVSNLY